MFRALWGLGLLGGLLIVAPPASAAETSADSAEAKLTLQTRSYPEPGKILVSVRVAAIPQTPDTASLSLDVQLRQPGQEEVVSRTTVDTQPGMREEIGLDAAELAAGPYAVAVELRRPAGEKLAEVSAEVQWPGRAEAFKNIKILNNFVWELLELKKTPDRAVEGDHEVSVPYDRWLLVRSKSVEGKPGQISVSLDSQVLHRHAPGAAQTLESMRFVKAGKHAVRVAAEGEAAVELLQVRAVPEVQQSRYPAGTMYVTQGVKYDWEFLQRHILPHVNTIISAGVPEGAEAHMREWKERGGKWISYMSRAAFDGKKDAEANVEACAVLRRAARLRPSALGRRARRRVLRDHRSLRHLRRGGETPQRPVSGQVVLSLRGGRLRQGPGERRVLPGVHRGRRLRVLGSLSGRMGQSEIRAQCHARLSVRPRHPLR